MLPGRYTSVRALTALAATLLTAGQGALAEEEGAPSPSRIEVVAGIEIWPPDGRHRSFSLSDCVARAVDGGGEALDPDRSGRIVRAWSDEAEDAYAAGDGATLQDVVVVSPTTFMVRAERQTRGNGRVYGVEFELVDDAGHTVRAVCRISVPRDWGLAAVDDGPDAGYFVTAADLWLAAQPQGAARR